MPLQASVFMLFEQVAALDFPKWYFGKSKLSPLFHRLHVYHIAELHFSVQHVAECLPDGVRIRLD